MAFDEEKTTKMRRNKPIRFNQARGDATVAAIQKTIELKFNLPAGSVRLVYPSGKRLVSCGHSKKLGKERIRHHRWCANNRHQEHKCRYHSKTALSILRMSS